jgi:hypothetical protein
MPSSGILRHAALVRTGVSEERSAYIIRVTRIGELVSVRKQILALFVGPQLIRFHLRTETEFSHQNVVQSCDGFINIPSSQTSDGSYH